MGFNQLDKINTLVALDINNGKISETARQFGISRPTLYAWIEQMENDIKLLAQVEAAKKNLANLEELQAFKAQSELSRRLEENPAKITTKDLVQIKDSGIKNSRLIRGESTANISTANPEISKLDKWLEVMLSMGKPLLDADNQPITVNGEVLMERPTMEMALTVLSEVDLDGVERGVRDAYIEGERKKLLIQS